KTLGQLAKAFSLPQSDITELMLEYQLYLEALKLSWTAGEKQKLLNPAVQFNPPVRFLQTKGHKEAVGITYDRPNLKIVFNGAEPKPKFKHMLKKLVIDVPGLAATAAYYDVFKDYDPPKPAPPSPQPAPSPSPSPPTPKPKGPQLKAGALYNYP